MAQCATLTGSIGVVGLRPTAKGLLDRARIGYELMSRGRHALSGHPVAALDEESRQRSQFLVAETYAQFKSRVAEGRGMTEEQVEHIARGRVWTGKQALELGLVDELGDFEAAVQKAKELAGLPLDRHVPVVPITAPRRFVLPQPFPEDGGSFDWLPPGLPETLRGGVWAIMPWDLRLRW